MSLQNTFKVIIGMNTINENLSFQDAFKLFWEEVCKTLDNGTSWQALETSNFLVYVNRVGTELPLDFYTARDLGYITGVLVEVPESKPVFHEKELSQDDETAIFAALGDSAMEGLNYLADLQERIRKYREENPVEEEETV